MISIITTSLIILVMHFFFEISHTNEKIVQCELLYFCYVTIPAYILLSSPWPYNCALVWASSRKIVDWKTVIVLYTGRFPYIKTIVLQVGGLLCSGNTTSTLYIVHCLWARS